MSIDERELRSRLAATAALAGPPRFTAPGLVTQARRIRRRRVRNTGIAAVSAAAAASAVAIPLALGGTAGPMASAPRMASPAAYGTLAGHLYGVGGPAPGLPRPWPGKVIVQGPGVHLTVIVGDRGTFSAMVPAGTYRVVGYSPRYGSGKDACRPSSGTEVTITIGHTTRASVLCQMS